mgnify:CR=1 FL=1
MVHCIYVIGGIGEVGPDLGNACLGLIVGVTQDAREEGKREGLDASEDGDLGESAKLFESRVFGPWADWALNVEC